MRPFEAGTFEMRRTLFLYPLLLCSSLASTAFSKLPTADPTPEAKAKAAEAAAKADWSAKVDVFRLCESQNRVAARYRASAEAAGAQLPPAPATPPCSDPGPFTYSPPEHPPIEAAGAHSPAGPAAAAPSTTQPSAAGNPPPKH